MLHNSKTLRWDKEQSKRRCFKRKKRETRKKVTTPGIESTYQTTALQRQLGDRDRYERLEEKSQATLTQLIIGGLRALGRRVALAMAFRSPLVTVCREFNEERRAARVAKRLGWRGLPMPAACDHYTIEPSNLVPVHAKRCMIYRLEPHLPAWC